MKKPGRSNYNPIDKNIQENNQEEGVTYIVEDSGSVCYIQQSENQNEMEFTNNNLIR